MLPLILAATAISAVAATFFVWLPRRQAKAEKRKLDLRPPAPIPHLRSGLIEPTYMKKPTNRPNQNKKKSNSSLGSHRSSSSDDDDSNRRSSSFDFGSSSSSSFDSSSGGSFDGGGGSSGGGGSDSSW